MYRLEYMYIYSNVFCKVWDACRVASIFVILCLPAVLSKTRITRTKKAFDSMNDIVLIVRLSSLKYNSVVLKEAVIGMALSCLEWHNIVFSYADILDGSTSLGKVCFLSGSLTFSIVMWTTVCLSLFLFCVWSSLVIAATFRKSKCAVFLMMLHRPAEWISHPLVATSNWCSFQRSFILDWACWSDLSEFLRHEECWMCFDFMTVLIQPEVALCSWQDIKIQ